MIDSLRPQGKHVALGIWIRLIDIDCIVEGFTNFRVCGRVMDHWEREVIRSVEVSACWWYVQDVSACGRDIWG